MDKKEAPQKKEHILAGIFGAFLFAFLYAILWVVIFIFWREDISHWSAFLCTWFSCIGYAFLSATRKSKLAVVFGILFGGLFTFVGHTASYVVKFFKITYTYTDVPTLFENIKELLGDFQLVLLTHNCYARFVQQLSIAATMALIGVAFYCYDTFWSKKAKQERSGIQTTILTEIWSDAPKKQEDIPASPDWIWNNQNAEHSAKKAPDTLVQNDISSSLLGDEDESDGMASGFIPKHNNDNQ